MTAMSPALVVLIGDGAMRNYSRIFCGKRVAPLPIDSVRLAGLELDRPAVYSRATIWGKITPKKISF
jgi:hypothetical protein